MMSSVGGVNSDTIEQMDFQDSLVDKPIKKRERTNDDYDISFTDEQAHFQPDSCNDSTSLHHFHADKPIKKREKQQDGYESDDCNDDRDSVSMEELTERAREELKKYLLSKGIDEYWMNEISVHVKPRRKRQSYPQQQNREVGGIVWYTGPDRGIFNSKIDLYHSILQARNRSSGLVGSDLIERRKQTNEEMKFKLNDLIPSLPLMFEGITVHSFGVINTRPSFHNTVQIYPIGYKAEMRAPKLKGGGDWLLICEIGELNDLPEFTIKIDALNLHFEALSEREIWAKVSSHLYLFHF
jgi:hypothetical protein